MTSNFSQMKSPERNDGVEPGQGRRPRVSPGTFAYTTRRNGRGRRRCPGARGSRGPHLLQYRDRAIVRLDMSRVRLRRTNVSRGRGFEGPQGPDSNWSQRRIHVRGVCISWIRTLDRMVLLSRVRAYQASCGAPTVLRRIVLSLWTPINADRSAWETPRPNDSFVLEWRRIERIRSRKRTSSPNASPPVTIKLVVTQSTRSSRESGPTGLFPVKRKTKNKAHIKL